MKQFTRSIAAALIAATALGAGLAAAEAQTKKVIRINHAGADDIVGTEHQMFAWVFANYVNSKAPTLDVKIFPNSGLGQSRQVIEAMQLGSGASMHVGGMAEFANFCKAQVRRDRPALHLHGLRPRAARARRAGRRRAARRSWKAIGFKVLGYMYSWGYRNVVTAKKEIKTVADLKGLKIRTIPTPVFVGADQRHGRLRHADEFRRGLYLAAERRARRLRAHRHHDGVVQVLRDRQVLSRSPST